jgi:hypothetical protein
MAAARGAEEVIVPLSAPRAKIGSCSAVRGTLLSSSIKSVRQRGLFERYLQLLPRERHDGILSLIASAWIPLDLATAHYETVNRIIDQPSEQHAIGREVADRIHGTLLGTLVKLANNAGVTPWIGLAQYQRLYDRLFTGGGGVTVTKIGPKEARIELVNVPLARIPYFRVAFRGVQEIGVELFCRRAYAKEIAAPPGATDTLVCRIAWA